MSIFGKKEKELQELLDQAVATCYVQILLAENGKKLYEHLECWTRTGFLFQAGGEAIDEGNLLVLRINQMILERFKGRSFEEASTAYKEAAVTFRKDVAGGSLFRPPVGRVNHLLQLCHRWVD